MENLDELKASRSKKRGRVTALIRKLTAALQYGDTTYQAIKSSLEEEFECLTDLDVQISELEKVDSTYLATITTSYETVIKQFYDSLKQDKDIENKKRANNLQKIVDRTMLKIQTIIERAQPVLSIRPSDLGPEDIVQLEVDTPMLLDEVNSLLENVSTLGELTDTSELETKVDKVVAKSEQLNRDANVLLKLSKMEPRAVAGKSMTLDKTGQDHLFSTFGKELHLSPSLPTGTNSSLKPDAHPFEPIRSSMTVDTTALLKPPSTGHGPDVSMAKMDPMSYPGISSVPLSHMYSTVGFPHKQEVKVPTYTSLSLPFHTSVSCNNSQPSLVTSPTYTPLSQIPSHTSVGYNISQPSVVHNVVDHCSRAPTRNFGPAIQTKKPSLPTFSGDRADWPEFRCVWVAMAESQFSNRIQLAMELKGCCRGKAAERVRHIYVTNEHAYEEIWQRLREEYDDPGLCSQEAMNRLMSLKSVSDQDFSGLVKTIDTVDGIYNQLRELNQLSAVHAMDVDRVSANLPVSTRMEWLRRYRDLSPEDKLSPFGAFVVFLRSERSAVARLAENQPKQSGPKKPLNHKTSSHVGHGAEAKKVSCAVHGEGHLTKDCKAFLKYSVSQRYNCLRKAKRCFNCFDLHPRDQCRAPVCASCGKSHNKLLCVAKAEVGPVDKVSPRASETLLASVGAMALYPICRANIKGSGMVTVLLDGGSNASYITSRCAQRHNLRRVDKVTLNVTTVGGKDREFQTAIYEANLMTTEGKLVEVTMYELPKITGKVSLLRSSKQVLEELFPQFDSSVLMRHSEHVDVLLGTDYFGLHPKEELCRVGDNLSLMKGQLGVCLVGTHPLLKDSDSIQGEVPRTLHLTEHHHVSTHHASLRGEHPAFSMAENFMAGEELGTECSPKCGACRCGKCPIPGHNLSFREEQELLMIRSNLVHDPVLKVWTASYPWVKDPKTLPDNYSSAIGTLRSTERSLMKDPGWAESYQNQIVDMVDRGVVRKLTPLELEDWKQPFFIYKSFSCFKPEV